MALLDLPAGAMDAGAMAAPSAPPEPFQWGAGGQRMTPEQIAHQREIAQALMQQGADYSPVASPWQGLARVSQGLFGGLQARRADKAEAANQAAQQQIIASLMAGGGASGATGTGGTGAAQTGIPAAGGASSIAPLLFDPYVDEGTKAAAIQMLKLQPKPPAPTDLQQNYQWLQGFNPQAAENLLTTKTSAPPIVAHNADGTLTVYPAGSIPQGGPTQTPAIQGAPQPGAIEDGYQFMGGNPADRNSWKPVGGPTPSASATFP